MFKKIACCVFVFSALTTALPEALAQVYRWTDNKGRKYVTDAPPPRTAKDSRYYDLRQRDENQSRALKRKKRPAKNFKFTPVVLYTSPDCGENCTATKKLLNERGVAFTEKVIKDELDEEWLIQQTGEKIVPSVTVGTTIQKGFDTERLNNILTNAGFPKAVKMPENKAPSLLTSDATIPNSQPADSKKTVADSSAESVENSHPSHTLSSASNPPSSQDEEKKDDEE